MIDLGPWNLVLVLGALATLPTLLAFRAVASALSHWWQRSYTAALSRANLAACRARGGPLSSHPRSAGHRVPFAISRTTGHGQRGTRP